MTAHCGEKLSQRLCAGELFDGPIDEFTFAVVSHDFEQFQARSLQIMVDAVHFSGVAPLVMVLVPAQAIWVNAVFRWI